MIGMLTKQSHLKQLIHMAEYNIKGFFFLIREHKNTFWFSFEHFIPT